MNDLYLDHIVTSIRKTILLSKDAEKCPHEGVKGRLREVFIQELLEPYLYPSMKICTGIIIDSYNQTSNQVDIIIYDPEIIPPAFLQKESGVIPYESVLATIEIKSRLNSTKLKESIKNAISIKKLKFSKSLMSNYEDEKLPNPLCTVFAFRSDISGGRKTEFTRLLETIKDTDYLAPISMLCIPEKVILMYGSSIKDFKDKNNIYNWMEIFPRREYEEVLIFIGALIDTCNKLKKERQVSFIQDYFIEDISE